MQKTLIIIRKELDKEKPDISYIKGMLDVLIGDENPVPAPLKKPVLDNKTFEATGGTTPVADTEADLLNAQAKAFMGGVDHTAISTEN